MASTKSPTGIKLKAYVQRNFTGLDSSVDVTAQDSKENQPLDICNNAFTDWRGQIVREPVGQRIIEGSIIKHMRFYGTDKEKNQLAYCEENEFGVHLKSDLGHEVIDAYPSGSVITSTVFNDAAHFCAQTGYLYGYDGVKWERNESTSIGLLSPKYIASVQRRLIVAGLIGKRTAVHLSRVDSSDVFPDDEDPNEDSVLRAGFIDIGNQLGTAQEITGIASFEQSRLAIFTESKTLIYVIDPDINLWEIDDRANINIGCISHNTIKQAGSDLVFCSNRGVHTIQRSKENGLFIFADILSKKVDLIYRDLLNKVTNREEISAVWEAETRQYRIFFPITSTVSTQLVLTINPVEDNPQSWSTNDYINARCGDIQGGRTIYGTSGGLYEVFDIEDTSEDYNEITMQVKTPVLWHGSMTEDKAGHSFFLHASGKGEVFVEIFDELDKLITTYNIEINDDHEGTFPDNSLIRQYIYKFEAMYKGLRVQLTMRGMGLVRIVAIGFNVRH